MTVELARRLLASGAIQGRQVEHALHASLARGVSLARALVEQGAIGERALDEELGRVAGVAVRAVVPSSSIAGRLPRGMCRMLAAVPTRVDPATGVIEIAALDPLDPHVAAEFGFQLGQPVKLVRGSLAAIEEAVRHLELGEEVHEARRTRRKTPAFPHGAPDSVPPPPPVPPVEEVPIPLVRRASLAPPPDSDGAPLALTARRSEPGRRGGGPSEPGSVEGRSVEPARAELTPSGHALVASEPPTRWDTHRSPSAPPRPALLVEPSPLAPRVSFPSSPPPALAPVDPPPDRDASPASAAPASSEPGAGRPPVPPPAPSSKRTLELDPSDVELLDDDPSADDGGPGKPLHEERGPRLPVPGASGATFGSLAEILDAIGRAPDRDAIIELALTGVLRVAERAAVFVVRRDHFQGWVCNPAFGSEEQLRSVTVASQLPSVLATAVAAGYYLGPIPGTGAHAALSAIMGGASHEIAVVVARVGARPALVLLADQLDDTLLGTRAMGEVAERVGAALERVLLRKG